MHERRNRGAARLVVRRLACFVLVEKIANLLVALAVELVAPGAARARVRAASASSRASASVLLLACLDALARAQGLLGGLPATPKLVDVGYGPRTLRGGLHFWGRSVRFGFDKKDPSLACGEPATKAGASPSP